MIIKNNKTYGIETKITQAPPQVQYDQLIFTNLYNGNNTLTMNCRKGFKNCSYSLDEGVTWTAFPADIEDVTTTTQNITFTDKLYIRWTTRIYSVDGTGGGFKCNQLHNVSGDLYGYGCYEYTYLFYQDNKLVDVSNLTFHSKIAADNCYSYMFYGCTSLTTAPTTLPATVLGNSCYYYMFYGCTSLTTAPALPATTLSKNCYDSMFYNCTALTTAPELPATTLADNCYSSMFRGCTSLTTAPELPATTLANNCYYYMFYGCTSLTTAPELPATTAIGYSYMFNGCSQLNYIKAMFTNTPTQYGFSYAWVQGVAANGTFVKNASATWDVRGVYGIPNDWTVETASE